MSIMSMGKVLFVLALASSGCKPYRVVHSPSVRAGLLSLTHHHLASWRIKGARAVVGTVGIELHVVEFSSMTK